MLNKGKPKYRKFSDLLIHPPRIVRSMFDTLVWDVKTEEKVIYLTFDDGPIPILTEKILNILSFFNAKATFFCVGDNVRKYPKIYNKILENGHATGNHTFSHLQGLRTSHQKYIKDIDKASKYIESDLFRPPHGRLKFSQLSEIQKKYKVILWDVLSFDFDKNVSTETCYNNVKHFTRAGSVVVFHDNVKAEKNMLYSLTQTLVYYSQLGFNFKSITSDRIKSKQRKRQNVFAGFF